VGSEKFIHTWHFENRNITFSWLGNADVSTDRVYAFAFTPEGKILLVSDARGAEYWLPGGGIEAGETEEVALARELFEEAAATLHSAERLGVQQADDPLVGRSLQAFYACHVSLAETFEPEHEISVRRLVTPEDFLDTLFWGRDDPKAEMLLNRALDFMQQ